MKKSIIQIVQKEIEEVADREMTRVIENILDENAEATAKRKITLTVEIKPDDFRQSLAVEVIGKSSLAPTSISTSSLLIGADENGEIAVVEVTQHAPGQSLFDGREQEQPSQIRLA